jgi:hypothetical protein
MKTRRACVVIVFLTAFAAAQETPDRCLNRNVVVTVTDGNWHTLAHLKVENFRATVDKQPIQVLSLEPNAKPKRLIVLVDASGSMKAAPGQADAYHLGLTLAAELVPYLTNDMHFAVYAFGDKLYPILALSEPPKTLPERLNGLPSEWREAHGRTALWDSVEQVVQSLEQPGPEDVVLAFTDGGDNRSKVTLRKLDSELLASEVRVFGVLVSEQYLGRTPEEVEGPDNLMSLAKESGGELLRFDVPGKKTKSLAADAREIMGQLDTPYLLQIKLPSPLTKDSKWKLQLQGIDHKLEKNFHLGYPQMLAGCARK